MLSPSLTPKPIERWSPHQFDTLATGEGYCVIDTASGHPVSDVLEHYEASETKKALNAAASYGTKRLTEALTCV